MEHSVVPPSLPLPGGISLQVSLGPPFPLTPTPQYSLHVQRTPSPSV